VVAPYHNIHHEVEAEIAEHANRLLRLPAHAAESVGSAQETGKLLGIISHVSIYFFLHSASSSTVAEYVKVTAALMAGCTHSLPRA
jgi:hypothetical protein